MKWFFGFTSLLVAGCALANPYAGQQERSIKALSDDEIKSYLAGAGAGFARAAELNSHPGPMHALELADPLALTPAQRGDLARLMALHKADARGLGAGVVRLEGELDALYAERRATRESVEAKAAEIGAAQARYRASHLTTHIETSRLLTAEQIARYDRLRGYVPGAEPAGRGHGGHAH